MTISKRHIMESNQRLIRQIERDIFHAADGAWEKVYSSFCKQHGDLSGNRVMQFKYKGEIYRLTDDVPLRSGIRPLHPTLVPEFESAYQMFVTEVEEEKRVLKNMLADAIRVAKYAEDLFDMLPELMHESIVEAGFFQAEDKPMTSVDQIEAFKEKYAESFSIFDLRKSVGAFM